MSNDPEELVRALIEDIEDLISVVDVVRGEDDGDEILTRLGLVRANLSMTQHYLEWVLEEFIEPEATEVR